MRPTDQYHGGWCILLCALSNVCSLCALRHVVNIDGPCPTVATQQLEVIQMGSYASSIAGNILLQ
jgi:hypothetical protein